MSRLLSEETASDLVCHCYSVTAAEIQQTILQASAESVEDVVEVTCAGAGCTACHCRIRRLLQNAMATCPMEDVAID